MRSSSVFLRMLFQFQASRRSADVALTFFVCTRVFFEPNRTGGRGVWWAVGSRVSKLDNEANNSSVRPVGLNARAFLYQHERSVLLVRASRRPNVREPGGVAKKSVNEDDDGLRWRSRSYMTNGWQNLAKYAVYPKGVYRTLVPPLVQ